MKTILIIDDDKKIQGIYNRLLSAEGYKVIMVTNAMDGYNTLKRESIDLVLLDIEMPEIQGNVICEIIQSTHKDVRVIVASVYPLDEQRQIIPEANDYYDKSQGIEMLLKKVKEALSDEVTC